jgi:hypothetical protein
MTPPVIEPETLQLVAQCLNHVTAHPTYNVIHCTVLRFAIYSLTN